MKTPLKVGDRVVCRQIYAGSEQEFCIKGTIEEIRGHAIEVRAKDFTVRVVHKLNVRRLVKKPRRRVWIPDNRLKRLGDSDIMPVSKRKITDDDIEFIEVKPKGEK